MGLPHLTFYVASLPRSSAGRADGPVIRILKSHRNDRGLYLHEYEHVRQWYMTLGLHSLLYPLVRRYRHWSEAEAYAAQVRDDLSDLDSMAARMTLPIYRLGITHAKARAAILRAKAKRGIKAI